MIKGRLGSIPPIVRQRHGLIQWYTWDQLDLSKEMKVKTAVQSDVLMDFLPLKGIFKQLQVTGRWVALETLRSRLCALLNSTR